MVFARDADGKPTEIGMRKAHDRWNGWLNAKYVPKGEEVCVQRVRVSSNLGDDALDVAHRDADEEVHQTLASLKLPEQWNNAEQRVDLNVTYAVVCVRARRPVCACVRTRVRDSATAFLRSSSSSAC